MHSVSKRDGVLSMTVSESFNTGDLSFTIRTNKRNCARR